MTWAVRDRVNKNQLTTLIFNKPAWFSNYYFEANSVQLQLLTSLFFYSSLSMNIIINIFAPHCTHQPRCQTYQAGQLTTGRYIDHLVYPLQRVPLEEYLRYTYMRFLLSKLVLPNESTSWPLIIHPKLPRFSNLRSFHVRIKYAPQFLLHILGNTLSK
jgi:hypothetical protein